MKTGILTGALLLGTILLAGCSGGSSDGEQGQAAAAGDTAATPATGTAAESRTFRQAPATEEEALIRCKAAAATLGSNLKTALKQAMQDGGPVQALGVCNTKAPAIASAIDEREGLTVGRTSLKWRNPDNAPDDWERETLEKFDADKAAGVSNLALETWTVVSGPDGKREFRFMKAIPALPLCLKCHGTNLAPEVATKLQALYPEDHATGYGLGDLRGAFTVTVAMAPAAAEEN